MTQDALTIEWGRDPGLASALAALMVGNLDAGYISHSELMEGRALNRHRWADGLESRLEAEFREALISYDETAAGNRVAVASRGADPVALAVIEIAPGWPPSFAVIADLVVDRPERGRGTAGRLVAWIEEEVRRLGVGRLFLESGVGNERAHRFFKRSGFETCSVVMMKEIGPGRGS